MEEEWKLPGESEPLKLTVDELLLVDWIICPMSQMIPGLDLDRSTDWSGVRHKVWAILSKLDPGIEPGSEPVSGQPDGPLATYTLGIAEPDAKGLFAAAPTTFRWAPAPGRSDTPDCGFALKSKLYQFLTKDYAPERPSTDARVEAPKEAAHNVSAPNDED